MRIDRRFVLGAALVALGIIASACGSGGDNDAASPSSGETATIASTLTLGGPPECPTRAFCAIGLEDTYGVVFGSFKPLDVGGPLTVAALDSGAIDVGLLFSTSSVINANGWVVLEDDKHLQQADNIAPVVREDVVNDEIAGLLNAISAALTSDNITALNKQVEIDKEDAADVAGAFLDEQGLLPTAGTGRGRRSRSASPERSRRTRSSPRCTPRSWRPPATPWSASSIWPPARSRTRRSSKGTSTSSPSTSVRSSCSSIQRGGVGRPGGRGGSCSRRSLKDKHGAVLLDYSAANDTNSFVVTAETAETYGLVTVSDLAKPAP